MQVLAKIRYAIIQNSKRLRTFSQPQQNTIIPINKAIFEEASLKAFIRFKDAFEQLANNNKQKQIQVELKGLNYLQIAYGSGSFVLQAESDTSTLFFTSPIGGTFKYYYDADQQRFYSNKDGHLLDQNLTRQAQKFVGDYGSFKSVIDYMKLDSQLNVYFAQSERRTEKESRSYVENKYSQTLYHHYLQLYEQNQKQTNNYENLDQEPSRNQTKKDLYIFENQKVNVTYNDLFQQNRALRKQLERVYAFIGSLKNQLNKCNQELVQMKRINQENQVKMSLKHQYILQQMQALLQNKFLLDQEVEYLKSQIKNNIKPLHIKNNNLHSKVKENGGHYFKQNNQKQQKQFIRSIQDMYQNISGMKQNNLIVIWRWLKQLALSYSKFTKWKKNNQKRIASACFQPLLALTLLSQLKLIN